MQEQAEQQQEQSAPQWGYSPHWTRLHDSPTAAAASLVRQEGQRLTRHVSEDGTVLDLRGKLRNPAQLSSVADACRRRPALTEISLACNALDDVAANQLPSKP
jgi:hypothetical protein